MRRKLWFIPSDLNVVDLKTNTPDVFLFFFFGQGGRVVFVCEPTKSPGGSKVNVRIHRTTTYRAGCAEKHTYNTHIHTHTLDHPHGNPALLLVLLSCLLYMNVSGSVRASLHDCVCVSAYISTSLMSSSQDTMGAQPLYLFVRQPDECNWQSYYNFTKAVFFYPWRWNERYCWQL